MKVGCEKGMNFLKSAKQEKSEIIVMRMLSITFVSGSRHTSNAVLMCYNVTTPSYRPQLRVRNLLDDRASTLILVHLEDLPRRIDAW